MFEKRLRQLREQNGYQTQQSLADALGVAQSTVANWEAGRREPNHETTLRLADFFRVSVDYLMGRTEEPPDTGDADGALKAALWGGDADLTEEEMEELWADVREYAAYKAQQCRRRREN